MKLDFINLPSYVRVFQAALGSDPWTENEKRLRDESPLLLCQEAEAHLTLALLSDKSASGTPERIAEYKRALNLVAKLPTAQFQHDFTELLLLDVPREDQAQFRAIALKLGVLPPNRIYSLLTNRRTWLAAAATIGIGFLGSRFMTNRLPRIETTAVIDPPTREYPFVTSHLNWKHLSAADDSDYLFANDRIDCRYRHHSPGIFQWLIHIDEKAEIVDSNSDQSELRFRREGSHWTDEERDIPWRYEFVIVLTANTESKSFRLNQQGRLSLVSEKFLRDLHDTDDVQVHRQRLKELLTQEFGHERASVRLTRYRSRNEFRAAQN